MALKIKCLCLIQLCLMLGACTVRTEVPNSQPITILRPSPSVQVTSQDITIIPTVAAAVDTTATPTVEITTSPVVMPYSLLQSTYMGLHTLTDNNRPLYQNFLDLDQIALTADDPQRMIGGDLKLIGRDGVQDSYSLLPIDGAVARRIDMGKNDTFIQGDIISNFPTTEKGGAGAPDYCGSYLSSLSTNAIPIQETDIYICVLTNEGHLSLVRIESLDSTRFANISPVLLNYLTWIPIFNEEREIYSTRYPVSPTPSATPLAPMIMSDLAHPILLTGTVRLPVFMSVRDPQDDPVGLDLDTGELTDVWENFEIGFTGSCGSDCYFTLAFNIINSNAREMSLEQPSFEECVQRLFDDSEEGFSSSIPGPIGMYACILTTENRVAIVRRMEMNIVDEAGPWTEVSYLVFDEVLEN